MTRSLRSRVSAERGPGSAVRSSIALVAAITQDDNEGDGRSAYLYRGLSEGLRGERLDRVQAGGVPEHEALDVLQAGRLDLILDVREGVPAGQREVLEPRHQHRLSAAELRAEVAQGVRDGRPRARARA